MRFSSGTWLVAVPLLALLTILPTTARAECGVDQVLFNTNGMAQGYNGELYAAVRCYLQQSDSSSYCKSKNLPKRARGYGQVRSFYGSNLTTWCTGMVTDFFATFYELQLQGKHCSGASRPTTFDLFTGTKCAVAGDPTPGAFCQKGFNVTRCLEKRSKRVGCRCSKRAKCSRKLGKGICKRKYFKVGGDKTMLKSEIKSVLEAKCS